MDGVIEGKAWEGNGKRIEEERSDTGSSAFNVGMGDADQDGTTIELSSVVVPDAKEEEEDERKVPTPTPVPLPSPAENLILHGTLYDLPVWRKCLILFTVSWMTLVITFSSTSLLPATPEISKEFNTTPTIINFTNAGVLLAMGLSSFIWGPISVLLGRKNAYIAAVSMLCGCSVGMALAPNMRVFTAMRILGGFTGTYFMVSGQTMLADIFEPVRSINSIVFCPIAAFLLTFMIDCSWNCRWVFHGWQR